MLLAAPLSPCVGVILMMLLATCGTIVPLPTFVVEAKRASNPERGATNRNRKRSLGLDDKNKRRDTASDEQPSQQTHRQLQTTTVADCSSFGAEWEASEDYCILLTVIEGSFDTCISTCGAEGAFVAIPLSDDMNSKLVSVLTGAAKNTLWLGYRDRAKQELLGYYEPHDSRAPLTSFRNFAAGQPPVSGNSTNACLTLTASASGQWSAEDCGTAQSCVCQKPAPNTIVPRGLCAENPEMCFPAFCRGDYFGGNVNCWKGNFRLDELDHQISNEYHLSLDAMTFDNHETKAVEWNGHVASVQSSQEAAFMLPVHYGPFTYFSSGTTMTHTACVDYCAYHGAQTLCVPDNSIYSFLSAKVFPGVSWLGATSASGAMNWENSHCTSTYTNWGSTPSDGQCVVSAGTNLFGTDCSAPSYCPCQYPTPESVMPLETNNFNTAEYLLADGAHTYSECADYCQANNAQLLCITSDAVNAFVTSFVGDSRVWIGYTDIVTEGTFEWDSALCDSMYENWEVGQPNDASGDQDCASLKGDDGGKWIDAECETTTRKCACQKTNFQHSYDGSSAVTAARYGDESFLVSNRRPYDECEAYCENLQTKTPCIADIGTDTFVFNLEARTYFSWLGLDDLETEGTFLWVNGFCSSTYLNWDTGGSGQPNNFDGLQHCASHHDSGQWFDDTCDANENCICQFTSANEYWIGATHNSGSWMWTDGSTWDYENWMGGGNGDLSKGFNDPHAIMYPYSETGEWIEKDGDERKMAIYSRNKQIWLLSINNAAAGTNVGYDLVPGIPLQWYMIPHRPGEAGYHTVQDGGNKLVLTGTTTVLYLMGKLGALPSTLQADLSFVYETSSGSDCYAMVCFMGSCAPCDQLNMLITCDMEGSSYCGNSYLVVHQFCNSAASTATSSFSNLSLQYTGCPIHSKTSISRSNGYYTPDCRCDEGYRGVPTKNALIWCLSLQ